MLFDIGDDLSISNPGQNLEQLAYLMALTVFWFGEALNCLDYAIVFFTSLDGRKSYWRTFKLEAVTVVLVKKYLWFHVELLVNICFLSIVLSTCISSNNVLALCLLLDHQLFMRIKTPSDCKNSPWIDWFSLTSQNFLPVLAVRP